ncbi:hypothetical protein PSTT_05753 [Puccinia striiformis]|uniref:Uncharacterized protein n=1 Tax=Puccinia striiformis TaxID=27350 RepID=A0A2S4VN86_9BASI|nr:hypothetical protein PSTT_05753 [Puccinia striiformis]
MLSIAAFITLHPPDSHPARMTGPEIKTSPLTHQNLSAHSQHLPRCHNQQSIGFPVPLKFTLQAKFTPCLTANTLVMNKILPMMSPPPAPASPLPSVNRIRPNRTKCIVIKLPIEYSVWVHNTLQVTRCSGVGAGWPPAEWAKVVSKGPLDVWQASPINYDWGLAKHAIIEVIGPTQPYLGRELSIADTQGLPTWQGVITGHVLYGVGKKFAIVSKNNWLGFATAAEAAYPFKPCLIKIIQPDPRVVPCNQARVSEGNKILILRNRNPEERAPLEQTQAQLATNPNVVVTTPGRDHALALRDHHLGLRQERGAPAREGEFAMHLS